MLTLLLLSLIGCLGATTASFAQVISIEGKGITKEETTQLARALGIAVGSPLNAQRVDEGIRQVFDKGNYDTLLVYTDDKANGTAVQIVAARLRRIKTVRFVGVEPDILDEVRSRISWEDGEGVDPRIFLLIQERLKTAYEARGYFNAEVTTAVQSTSDTENEVEIRAVANAQTLVNRIVISAGDKAEEKSLLGAVSLKKGQPYSKAAAELSIEKINKYLQVNQYSTSRVEDWSLSFSPDRTTVDVTFMVKLGDRFQFQFFGNTVFDEYELRSLLSEEVISQVNATSRIVEQIEDKYQAAGYHFVKVKMGTQSRQDSSARPITVYRFDIDEGPKVLIDRLHFNGGTGELTEAEVAQVFFASGAGVIKRRIFWEKGLGDSVRDFKSRLERMGYLSVSVSSPRTAFSNDNRGVELFFDIEMGSRTVVKEIFVSGGQYFKQDRILQILGVRVGESFDRQKFIDGKENLLKAYRREGFVDVKLAQEIDKNGGVELSRDLKDATIRLDIIEGTRFFVGDIAVEGNNKTKNEVILRELKVKANEPLNPELVARSEEDVNALGLFSRVEIVTGPNPSHKNKKDLKVIVRENKSGVGEVGLGGFYEDPRFRLRTFVGVTYRNMFGQNQTGSGRLELSVPFSRQKSFVPFLEYSGALGYRSPYPFKLPLTFIGQLTFDSYEVKTLDTEITLQSRTKIEGRIEKKFSPHLTGLYRLYQLERTNTEILDKVGSSKIDLIGSTGPGVIVDFRDDIYNPTKGSLHSLNVELASPLLLSQEDISFVMVLGRNSFYVPLFAGVGLSLYGGFGYAQSLFQGKPVPSARLTSDLSLGGRGSIRGFSVRRFSPVADPSSPSVEKTAFYNGRAELNVPLFDNFSGALFLDTGQIYPNLRPDKRHDGVGLGVRYKTPIGPIVVDIAQGLGDDREELKFYFTVGTL